jgi:hypothetical protein
VLLGSVIPFTLIVILPTNKQLLSAALDRRSAETERLLARWGMLHAVRSVLSGLALFGQFGYQSECSDYCWHERQCLLQAHPSSIDQSLEYQEQTVM